MTQQSYTKTASLAKEINWIIRRLSKWCDTLESPAARETLAALISKTHIAMARRRSAEQLAQTRHKLVLALADTVFRADELGLSFRPGIEFKAVRAVYATIPDSADDGGIP